MNLRDRVPLLAKLSERLIGLAAERSLPSWRPDCFRSDREAHGPEAGPEVALFADTFNATFERETIDAALRVLVAAGYRVHVAKAPGRRICCGRTFLAAGLIEQARFEASRALAVLAPFAERNIPIVGLEPSCLLTFRDEATAMRLGESADKVAGCSTAVRGVRRARTGCGALQDRARADRGEGAVARPLPSEELRRHGGDGKSASADSRARRADDRFQLLRHGRRVRLSGGNP